MDSVQQGSSYSDEQRRIQKRIRVQRLEHDETSFRKLDKTSRSILEDIGGQWRRNNGIDRWAWIFAEEEETLENSYSRRNRLLHEIRYES